MNPTIRVHEDIDGILQDIKETHKDDGPSAPENAVAEEIKRDLEEGTNIKRRAANIGSPCKMNLIYW